MIKKTLKRKKEAVLRKVKKIEVGIFENNHNEVAVRAKKNRIKGKEVRIEKEEKIKRCVEGEKKGRQLRGQQRAGKV